MGYYRETPVTLDQYHIDWEKDAAINADDLDRDARNVPLLHAKWWKYYTTERLRYRKLDMEHKTLYRQKWEWYLGKLDDSERVKLGWQPQPLKILSANVSVYLDADHDLQENAKARVVLEETLRFLEDVIKVINKRGYDIKNAIDYLRFKMGM